MKKNNQDSDQDKQNRQDDQANKKNFQDGVKKIRANMSLLVRISDSVFWVFDQCTASGARKTFKPRYRNKRYCTIQEAN